MENDDSRLLSGGDVMEWKWKRAKMKQEDELLWKPIRLDQKGKSYSWGGGKRIGEILRDEVYKCAFCNGSGEKPRGAKCSACRGTGEVRLKPPVVMCAYCKGGGEEHPRANVTCTACRGKGFISVKEPVERCPHCRGTGADPHSKLSCIVCRGAGVVTAEE